MESKIKVGLPLTCFSTRKRHLCFLVGPREPNFFDGFRFAEVLLNRETAFGPLGFGGFRALSDFRVRGIPGALKGGPAALSNAQGG